MFSREFLFCLFISYTPVCMWIALHLKETVLWGRITWSGMGKQNTQARKVYSTVVPRAFTLGNGSSMRKAGERNWFSSYTFVYFLSSLHKFSGPTFWLGKTGAGWFGYVKNTFFFYRSQLLWSTFYVTFSNVQLHARIFLFLFSFCILTIV